MKRLFIFLFTALCAGNAPSNNDALFAQIHHCLVIVETPNGVGSGFVAEIDGEMFIVTNEHVLRGGWPARFHTIDGVPLTPRSVRVADHEDLVLLRFTNSMAHALTIADTTPLIGTPVSVFGNSGGERVATSCEGTILGVGPDRVEVSAQFVSGNSGSPIVNSNGHVIAVATYATRDDNPEDWVKRGTRYAEVRRFGMRLHDIRWTDLSLKEYFKRADALSDLSTFCQDLYNVRFTKQHRPKTFYEYDFDIQKLKYRRNVGLCQLLATATLTWNQYLRTEVDYYDSQKYKYSGSLSDRTHARMNTMNVWSDADKHQRAYYDIYNRVDTFISGNDWKTTAFKEEAAFWLAVTAIIMNEE